MSIHIYKKKWLHIYDIAHMKITCVTVKPKTKNLLHE